MGNLFLSSYNGQLSGNSVELPLMEGVPRQSKSINKYKSVERKKVLQIPSSGMPDEQNSCIKNSSLLSLGKATKKLSLSSVHNKMGTYKTELSMRKIKIILKI